jgi:uncharacterized protein YcbK (DUF882 family)
VLLLSLPVVVLMAQAIAGPPGPAVPPALKAPVKAAPAKAVVKTGARPAARPVKKRPPPKPKMVELFQVNTKETLRLRFVDDRGRRVGGLQQRANRFFRCHHTGRAARMNPRLVKLLFDTGRHWPGSRIEVVSGFRAPTVAKNPHSPHMKGLACDFRVTGVKNTDLRDYLRRAFPHIGVGYYPNSSFVHLDVRGKGASAFWIDYSGPGENAMYSDNPGEDLRSGRADTFRPTLIDPSWAERDDPPPVELAGGAAGREGAPGAAPAAVGQQGAAAPELSAPAGR